MQNYLLTLKIIYQIKIVQRSVWNLLSSDAMEQTNVAAIAQKSAVLILADLS